MIKLIEWVAAVLSIIGTVMIATTPPLIGLAFVLYFIGNTAGS